jgi:hypothetical protein
MAESNLHRHIKYSIAKGLIELNYQSGVEVPTGEGGYIDVQGKRGKEIINIELVKTHIPDWLIVKFQEAKEIRRNIFTEVLNRLTENGTKKFYTDMLIKSLVETEYFDDESATKYVNKIFEEGTIESCPDVYFNEEENRYIEWLPQFLRENRVL